MRVDIEVAGDVRTATVGRQGETYVVEIAGRRYDVDATGDPNGRLSLRMVDTGRQHAVTIATGPEPGALEVSFRGMRLPVRLRAPGGSGGGRSARADGPARICAPMPGKVVRVLVRPGDVVTARQAVVVVEAMKMENELRAGRDGVVSDVLVSEGASVDAGAPLVVVG
jgi:biotin carboxyl carrier protein